MSAEFHDHRFHMLASQCGQAFAHGNRSGKRDQAYLRLRNQVIGYLSGIAEDQIQGARRQSAVGQRLRQQHGAGRCFFRRFDDDRTASRKRARDFSGRRTHREIPWRKRRHNADRLAQHRMPHTGLAGYYPAIDSTSFGGVPLDDFAAAQDL